MNPSKATSSRDPVEELHHIYDLGQPAPDPTCYLASTSRTEAATAPARDSYDR